MTLLKIWLTVAIAAVMLIFFPTSVLRAYRIPSGAMENTLQIGDHLYVNNVYYGIRALGTDKLLRKWHDVQRGDVVVFECPPSALSEKERERHVRKDFINRVVTLPGDEVMVKNKRLYINGLQQNESYAIYRGPMVIPDTRGGSPFNFQSPWESGDLA